MRVGKAPNGGVAWKAGAQAQTCPLFGRSVKEASRRGQGLSGPADSVANGASCCAAAKKRSTPGPGPESPLVRASAAGSSVTVKVW
eukprot:3001522-Amphidinium_carterae.1